MDSPWSGSPNAAGSIGNVLFLDPLLILFLSPYSVGFRISGEFVPERTLQDAVSSLANTLGHVSEFTTAIDNRKVVRAYGFFVELDGKLGVLSPPTFL